MTGKITVSWFCTRCRRTKWYGPRQIEAQIDQDPEISKIFTVELSSSKYSQGNMFVIPIGDSILYVEPVYLGFESSIPGSERVIVAYGDKSPTKEHCKKLWINFSDSSKKRPSGSPDGDSSSQKDKEITMLIKMP